MSHSELTLTGNIVDIINRKIYPGRVHIKDGKIASIAKESGMEYPDFIMPGFIDAHVHIESSMLVPSEFARLATVHGTVATVSDPHEIGNVLGIEGVRYVIENGKKVPFHFFFGAPSCVPATQFESSGAEINADGIQKLFLEDHLIYLSEMMNYPGVINNDPEVLQKLDIAKKLRRNLDGHAPGLMGEPLRKYFSHGITTDHECFTLEEGREKASLGMKILIREGSAAKNFEALHPLIASHPELVMFCSDDKHPDDLVKGHMNLIAKRALDKGHDLMNVLRSLCLYPVLHYGLDVGLLRENDSADLIVVRDLKNFHVKKTYVGGKLVAENGRPLIPRVTPPIVNHFFSYNVTPSDFLIPAEGNHVRLIVARDGELVTDSLEVPARNINGYAESDPKQDILKIAVVNRYQKAPIAKGFIQGFGLKKGALASSVAHDSHNIVAVGVNDIDLARSVNALMDNKGGIACTSDKGTDVLPLPIAGIMSPMDGYQLADEYEKIDRMAKELGSHLRAPFMTLSFMALLVIPSLKLSDLGLFDGKAFTFTKLFTK